MIYLLATLVASQALNLPDVTVDVTTCEPEIHAEREVYNARCSGTSQKVEDIFDQFCKRECITSYDKFVNKIKEVCDLTPEDLVVLEKDIKDFNSSQGSICSNEVEITATAVNTTPGETGVPNRPQAGSGSSTRASAPAATQPARPPTSDAASTTPSATSQPTATKSSSAEKVTAGLFGFALLFL